MKNPKVSVIIPAYNAQKTLRRCIISLINQEYENYEIIIINNKSTDKTEEIIKEFARKNKKIKSLFEECKGRGPARNTGEKYAKGDIILMTDADCIAPENWIKEMIRPIVEEDYDAVQGSVKSAENNFWANNFQKGFSEKFNIENKTIIDRISTANFAIKRIVLKKAGYTSRDFKILIDLELSVRLQKKGIKLKKQDVKVEHHHLDSFSKVIKSFYLRGKAYSDLIKHHPDIINTELGKNLNQYSLDFFSFKKLKKIFKTGGYKLIIYTLIIGASWKIGLLKNLIKPNFSHTS